MKLVGELKKKVESAPGMEEKKALIADAGMELDDKELSAVAGGTASTDAGTEYTLISVANVYIISLNDAYAGFTLPPGIDVTIDSEPQTQQQLPELGPMVHITAPVKGWIAESTVSKKCM